MIIKLFKGALPSKLILVIFISIIGWLPFLVWGSPPEQSFTIEIIAQFVSWISQQWSYSVHFIIFTLASLLSVYIVQFNFKYILIDQRTYIPAIISVLLAVFLTNSTHAISILFLSIIWLACFDILFSQAGMKISVKAMFNTGLIIAVCSLFMWQSVFLIPIIWILSFIINSFNIRGVLSIVVGFATICLLFFYILFYYEITSEFNAALIDLLKWKKTFIELSLRNYIPLMLSMTLIISGLLATLFSLNNKKIITRKYYSAFFLSILVISLGSFAIPQIPLEYLFITTIPLTFITSNYLLQSKLKWVPNILFLFFFLGIALFWII